MVILPPQLVDKLQNQQKAAKLKEQQAKFAEQPTEQGSTLLLLFGFFGLIILGSYLVHRAGGIKAIELAFDRRWAQFKDTLFRRNNDGTGTRGRYSMVESGLPR